MPSHQETREVPFSAREMYELVADIEQYPAFLPWCEALRIRSDNRCEGHGELVADMVVRYKLFLERFRSLVTTNPDELKINAEYVQGPVRKLQNCWGFVDQEEGGSVIEFSIDFEFRNILMQRLANEVFDRAFKKMSDAFVARAYDLYGDRSVHGIEK